MRPIVDPLGNLISDYYTTHGASMAIEVDTFKAPSVHRGPRLQEGIHPFPLCLDPASFTIPPQGPPPLPGQADFQQFKFPLLEIPATLLKNSVVPTEPAPEIYQYHFAAPERILGVPKSYYFPMHMAHSQSSAWSNSEGADRKKPRR
jgi:hypothetical protein